LYFGSGLSNLAYFGVSPEDSFCNSSHLGLSLCSF
jgi:hypothetical protein